MATSPNAIRGGLERITARALRELAVVTQAPPEQRQEALLLAVPLVVPSQFDAAGLLAVDWYDELRAPLAASLPPFTPDLRVEAATAWIEREIEAFRVQIDADLEAEVDRLMRETEALVQKEVARGFRDTIEANARTDEGAIGWSRHARPGACKFCLMAADKGAVYRTEEAARFAAHTNCHCVARPEFEGGTHGPEATALQYVAASSTRTPAQRAVLRDYLNEHYPDAHG